MELARGFAGNERFGAVPSLPDSWVWVSERRLSAVEGPRLNVQLGINALIAAASRMCSTPETMLKHIRADDVRIVNVSRARYNPRFRGRLLVDGQAARRRLLHITLCLAHSRELYDFPRETAFS